MGAPLLHWNPGKLQFDRDKREMSKGGDGENGKRYSEQQQILGSEKSESTEQTEPGAASTGASSRVPVLVKGAYEVGGRPRDLG